MSQVIARHRRAFVAAYLAGAVALATVVQVAVKGGF